MTHYNNIITTATSPFDYFYLFFITLSHIIEAGPFTLTAATNINRDVTLSQASALAGVTSRARHTPTTRPVTSVMRLNQFRNGIKIKYLLLL